MYTRDNTRYLHEYMIHENSLILSQKAHFVILYATCINKNIIQTNEMNIVHTYLIKHTRDHIYIFQCLECSLILIYFMKGTMLI